MKNGAVTATILSEKQKIAPAFQPVHIEVTRELNRIPTAQVSRFETELLARLHAKHQDILDGITSEKALTEKLENDLKAALASGYPVSVASSVGFGSSGPYTRNALGQLRASGTWPHQMCFIGYDAQAGAYCMNSWGPTWVGGPTGPGDPPPGGFYVAWSTAQRMLDAEDSFAFAGDETETDRIDLPKVRMRRRVRTMEEETTPTLANPVEEPVRRPAPRAPAPEARAPAAEPRLPAAEPPTTLRFADLDPDFELPGLDLLAPVRSTGQTGFTPAALQISSERSAPSMTMSFLASMSDVMPNCAARSFIEK